MKKQILLATLATFLISCGANPQKYFNELLDKIPIGTTESDFKTKVENERLVESTTRTAVYKVEKRTYHDLYGWRSDYRFFYFVDGKLVQINEGQRAVDYRIKVD